MKLFYTILILIAFVALHQMTNDFHCAFLAAILMALVCILSELIEIKKSKTK